jgi:hypothetical protein
MTSEIQHYFTLFNDDFSYFGSIISVVGKSTMEIMEPF